MQDISRIVVKLGTGVLTNAQKQLDPEQVGQLVSQIAAQHQAGKELVLVSSGAVGAGMGTLGYAKRPTSLAELQACAAVGQTRLMATYERLFAPHNLVPAQILLTHEDLQHHDRHLNARNTLLTLLNRGVIPIINENDSVSVTELKFGDNDTLSALVASLIPADLLIILTTVEGVMTNFGSPDSRTLSTIQQIDEMVERLAGGTTSATAVGGMTTKIQAAKIAMRAGIPMVIASGRKNDVLGRILNAEEEGTAFIPNPKKLKSRKRWLAFFHHPKGALIVDDGAKKALRENGKSLLLPGITRCHGTIAPGDVVSVCDLNGTEFARGICRYSAAEIQTRQPAKKEVVHRDDLVIL